MNQRVALQTIAAATEREGGGDIQAQLVSIHDGAENAPCPYSDQVAMSAIRLWPRLLPATVITYCPRLSLPVHSGPPMRSGLPPSLNGSGCGCVDSIGLGVHPGLGSLLLRARCGWPPRGAPQVRLACVAEGREGWPVGGAINSSCAEVPGNSRSKFHLHARPALSCSSKTESANLRLAQNRK